MGGALYQQQRQPLSTLWAAINWEPCVVRRTNDVLSMILRDAAGTVRTTTCTTLAATSTEDDDGGGEGSSGGCHDGLVVFDFWRKKLVPYDELAALTIESHEARTLITTPCACLGKDPANGNGDEDSPLPHDYTALGGVGRKGKQQGKRGKTSSSSSRCASLLCLHTTTSPSPPPQFLALIVATIIATRIWLAWWYGMVAAAAAVPGVTARRSSSSSGSGRSNRSGG